MIWEKMNIINEQQRIIKRPIVKERMWKPNQWFSPHISLFNRCIIPAIHFLILFLSNKFTLLSFWLFFLMNFKWNGKSIVVIEFFFSVNDFIVRQTTSLRTHIFSNQSKLCPNASWNQNGMTLIDSYVLGSLPSTIFFQVGDNYVL